jgi:hypothetical protein
MIKNRTINRTKAVVRRVSLTYFTTPEGARHLQATRWSGPEHPVKEHIERAAVAQIAH